MKKTIMKSNQRRKYLVKIMSLILIMLSIIIFQSYSNKVFIEFQNERTPPSLNAEPFKQEEIKEISVEDNIVSVKFQMSLEGSYFGYFADGGGGEATINLYKKRILDDDSLKYEGKTEIDLSSMPKIKKLYVTVQ